MIIVLVGAPGAGKGTHGRRISAKRGWPHVSSGDLLREAVEKQTPLGLEAVRYMKAGVLVPDAIMLRWVEELLDKPEYADGIVLDGFPRTVPQAEGLDELLERHDLEIDCVLFFDIVEESAVERLASRISCSRCGLIYNLVTQPPPESNECDRCGGKLEVRADDGRETIHARFIEFRGSTQPMIDYYQSAGKLARIDTRGGIEEVGARVTAVLDGLAGRKAPGSGAG